MKFIWEQKLFFCYLICYINFKKSEFIILKSQINKVDILTNNSKITRRTVENVNKTPRYQNKVLYNTEKEWSTYQWTLERFMFLQTKKQ